MRPSSTYPDFLTGWVGKEFESLYAQLGEQADLTIGPPGPTGATGPPGATGATGPSGATGLLRVIGQYVGDGVSTITTGVAAPVSIPVAGAITKVRLLSADPATTSGSIVIDIWKDTYANFPPTVADTITASAKPTITTATKSEDATLTGWTTSVAAGDVLLFNVESVTSLKRVVIELTVTSS